MQKIYDFIAQRPSGELVRLSQFAGKVLLIVNTASKCGFTPQFAGLEELYQRYGQIDVLVNNAGITQDTLMLKMTEEDFEKVIKINLTGAFNMTQAVLKQMIKAREGAIINMSSVVGLMGNIGQANYAASKAGLIGFTKSVAREVANRNVRVNALAPGMIESDMTAVLSDKVKEATLAQIPMKHFGQAEHIADATVFLAGQDYLTGQVLAVDGGLSM